VALLAATALLYLWGLGASGWANSFYSAAAQAGSQSWKALFFGSSDAANSITVDKPPMALWVMGLSARVFGVNAWSILVPQALAGVASVGVLYATVKRWFGAVAGLIAGAVLATTPVATLMFRFNNPDAFLVLVLIGAVACFVRAFETTSTRWLVATWALVGCGFLTKMLQALMVAPALALVYLALADTPLRRRFLQSAAGFVSLVVSAGWYVAVVELWPKSSRPYIGGSPHNSLLELTLGYNGFGRLTGNESGSANNGGMWGATGWGRMFNREFGSQASWLIPAALILLVVGLWWTRRAPRTDRTRAALLIWGGWLAVTGAAFSFGQGIIHPYYSVALAPAVGALVGIGGALAWQRRDSLATRVVLGATIGVTAWWGWSLLGRSDWNAFLAPAVLAVGMVTAVLVIGAPTLRGKAGASLAAVALVVGLAGPTAYSLQTASTTHGNALPSAGPDQGGRTGPGGRGPGGFGPRGFGPRGGAAARGVPGFGFGAPPGASQGLPGGGPPFGGGTGGGAPGGGANPGGLLSGSTSSAKITALLDEDAGSYRWAAAAIGSNSASGFQLASGKPVMPIGGFNGSDPSPTLAQFKQYVADGDIHWFIADGGGFGGGMGPGMGRGPGRMGGTSSTAGEISAWVTANSTATTVDGVTLYDLSRS
jgi:4-amino-4-deoxy-L-arabinose transferase-like glycosyltransferase